MSTAAEVECYISFGRVAQAVYDDRRFPPATRHGGSTRELVLALAWVRYSDPRRRSERERRDRWNWIASKCGGWRSLRWVIDADVPCFDPGDDRDTQCPVPLPRAKRPCGRRMSTGFRVSNPATGEWRVVGYCTRHDAEARAEHRAERARREAGIPEPVPNKGGLLAAYFGGGWASKVYRWAQPKWEPGPYGVSADDWPVHRERLGLATPELPEIVSRPRLAVVNGESGSDDDLGEPPVERPTLTLVTPGGAS